MIHFLIPFIGKGKQFKKNQSITKDYWIIPLRIIDPNHYILKKRDMSAIKLLEAKIFDFNVENNSQ